MIDRRAGASCSDAVSIAQVGMSVTDAAAAGVVQPFALLIYFAVLQATNSHPWAWLVTITPCSSLALVIMMTVNFEKGKIDAGRVEGVKGKDAAVA